MNNTTCDIFKNFIDHEVTALDIRTHFSHIVLYLDNDNEIHFEDLDSMWQWRFTYQDKILASSTDGFAIRYYTVVNWPMENYEEPDDFYDEWDDPEYEGKMMELLEEHYNKKLKECQEIVEGSIVKQINIGKFHDWKISFSNGVVLELFATKNLMPIGEFRINSDNIRESKRISLSEIESLYL